MLARASSATHLHAHMCLLCAVNRLLPCPWSARSAEDHEIYSLLHPQPLLAGRARPAVGDVPPRPQCRGKATTMVVILSTWCAAVSTPPLHALPTAASRPHVLLIPTFSPGCVGRHLSAGHLDAFLTVPFDSFTQMGVQPSSSGLSRWAPSCSGCCEADSARSARLACVARVDHGVTRAGRQADCTVGNTWPVVMRPGL